MQVHFIDVGQGDATLIACDGHFMLIDAGNNDKGTAVQSYLMSQGVQKLDYVIGTHPDADHIGGLDVVIYKFDCDTIIMPNVANDTRTYDDVVQAMKSKGYQTTYPAVGETYTLGGAAFTIVAPNADYGNDMNYWSVGVLVQNGNNRFLFTGDAEEKAEDVIDIEAKEEITYDDFTKLQFQVGEIISCEAVEKSKKLLCSQVRVGSEVKQIVSGIRKYYTPEEMVGKKVMVLVNLKPAKLAGVLSEGMLLCAEDAEGNLALMTPEKPMPAAAEIC